MKKRTQAREFAIQMMYQGEILFYDGLNDYSPGEISSLFWKSFNPPLKEIKEFAEILFYNSFQKREELDKIISDFLKKSWSLDRLGEMEKCILRVSLYELLNTDTPAYAVLDDYVTLTKKFTDEKTASFVNGLLEKVRITFSNNNMEHC